jgi:cell division protein FtsB
LIAVRAVALSFCFVVLGGSVVALAQSYTSQERVQQAQRDTAQDYTIAALKEKLDSIEKESKEKEERIRSLEDSRNKMYGAMALISFVFGLLHAVAIVLQIREHTTLRGHDDYSGTSD